eukprot:jgi/Ulvmu1/4509/UM002_0235.1
MAGKDVFRNALLLAVQHARPIAAALIVAGYVGALVMPALNKATFFDENALMVHNSIPIIGTASSGASVNSVITRIESISADISAGHNITTVLAGQGFDVHTQLFDSEDGSKSCVNNYVIVPSVHGDGSEGLAVVTPVSVSCKGSSQNPWYSSLEPCWHQTPGATTSVLALGTTLTQHLQGVPWLARDLVWLIPDASCGLVYSTQAWADLALGRAALDAAAIGKSVKAGRLQQAFVIEAQTTSWQTVEVSAMGRQGLLPKLDVVLLINFFLNSQVKLKPKLPQRRPELVERLKALLPKPANKQQRQYASLLQGTLSFVAMQVGGRPDGAHAPFKEYAVDAVTARVLPDARSRSAADKPPPKQVLLLAAALEGTLRSCNNLLERLHHSYFMYLLPSLDKFVPVEIYTLPPALQLLALFLLAANACLYIPPRPPAPPTRARKWFARKSAPASADEEGSGEEALVDTYPRNPMQPIEIRGGWPALTQSCCKVAAVHIVSAAVGLLVHACASRAAGGTAISGSQLSWPLLLMGAASGACMMVLLVEQGFKQPWSSDGAQMDHAVSLLSTVAIMAGWMFVNWADVYVALLCCTPLLASRKMHKVQLSAGVIMGTLAWIVFNPWVLLTEDMGTNALQAGARMGTWLFRIGATSQAFVWMVYAPTWIKAWI